MRAVILVAPLVFVFLLVAIAPLVSVCLSVAIACKHVTKGLHHSHIMRDGGQGLAPLTQWNSTPSPASSSASLKRFTSTVLLPDVSRLRDANSARNNCNLFLSKGYCNTAASSAAAVSPCSLWLAGKSRGIQVCTSAQTSDSFLSEDTAARRCFRPRSK